MAREPLFRSPVHVVSFSSATAAQRSSFKSASRSVTMSTKFEVILVVLWMILIIGTIYFVSNKTLLSRLIPLYIVVMIGTLIIARRGRD